MNADGSNPTDLTNNPTDDAVDGWSPDGKQILFHTDRDGNSEIYVMNADGSDQTNLTNSPADDEIRTGRRMGRRLHSRLTAMAILKST